MEQEEIKLSMSQKTRRFIRECARVLAITKKPDKQEFSTIVKVTSLGIAVIGLIGFFLQMIKQILFA
jgi:protein transport protein SEC61 subunit gamma and related proteins